MSGTGKGAGAKGVVIKGQGSLCIVTELTHTHRYIYTHEYNENEEI